MYDPLKSAGRTPKVSVESKEGKKDSTEAKSYYYPVKWLAKEGYKHGSEFTWKITIGDGHVDLGGTKLGKDEIEEIFIENVSQSGYPSEWYDDEAGFETNIPGLTFEQFKEGGYTFQKGSTEQYYIRYRTYHNPVYDPLKSAGRTPKALGIYCSALFFLCLINYILHCFSENIRLFYT